jgi:hypothetical protein
MKKAVFVLSFIGILSTGFKCINADSKINIIPEERLKIQLKEVKKLINTESKWNQEIAFFIDMKINSGKNRFFICDLKNNKVIDQGLVAHGSGSEKGIQGQLKFSNVEGSLCTSLGKYAIGNYYQGKFGKSYNLYGLDKTNNNALTRHIVLHQFSTVPYEEQETSICNSYGCPMVNEKFYKRIEKIIDNSKTKILLNIYY